MKIGILGLQGAFLKHKQMLDLLKVNSEVIRYPDKLDDCDALILPGGESTTISKLLDKMKLREKLEQFSGPIFGTCAGAVLLSENCNDPRIKTLAKIPLQTIRNAYGRQTESFIGNIDLEFSKDPFKAIFIRAPKLEHISKEIEIIGEYQKTPVIAKYKNILISTFHPELSNDSRIHKYFVNLVTLDKT